MAVQAAFKRLLFIASITALFMLSVDATQVMHRPERYKYAPNRYMIETDPKTHVIQRRDTGKVSFAYFTNWGIYGANFRKYRLNFRTVYLVDLNFDLRTN